MTKQAQYYVGSMIAAGAVILLFNLPFLAPANGLAFALAVLLAGVLAPLKLRLPGMEGTYAPTFVPILYGIAHLSLAETLIIGMITALAGSYINAQKRPAPVQVAFNAANLALSIGICFGAEGLMSKVGLTNSTPAVTVLTAGLYFVVNTGVVSGVLALLQGKTLAEVTATWYVWSFPYYLAGAAAVNLATPGFSGVSWEGVMVLIVLLVLLHFYCGLAEGAPRGQLAPAEAASRPAGASAFLLAVLSLATLAVAFGVFSLEPTDGARFAALLGLTIVASALKVRLPGLDGTVSLGFVLLLAAVADLAFGEVTILATVASLVQCLWRPVRRPQPIKVAFSAGSVVLASAVAFGVVRVWLAPALDGSLAGQLGLATVLFYGTNTLLVSTMLSLAASQPLGTIWRRSHFWVFPYYLVGAAAAALLVSTSRTNGWVPALMVLPTMILVFVSYRMQVGRQVVT